MGLRAALPLQKRFGGAVFILKKTDKEISYKTKILAHLLKNRYLNLFQAIELGTSRPAEYIRQLREEGWQIVTERRSAGKKWYGVYRLDGAPKESNVSQTQNA